VALAAIYGHRTSSWWTFLASRSCRAATRCASDCMRTTGPLNCRPAS